MSDIKAPASLSVLADSKAPGITKAGSFRVDPSKVQFEPGFNLRENTDETKAHVQRLAAAMLAGAFIPPIDVVVVNGKIICRDGHCRTRAAIMVRKQMPDYTIEARQFRGNDADAVIHMLGTGSGQRPLTPLEQGQGYLRLIKMGKKPQDIANALGVSRPTIDNGITLAEAPTKLQQMITNGDVSATTVRKAIQEGSAAVKALEFAVKEKQKQEAAESSKPAPAKKEGKAAKPAKKKKVTAKHLKTGSKKAAPKLAPDEVSITFKKEDARAALDALKGCTGYGSVPGVKEFAVELETALL